MRYFLISSLFIVLISCSSSITKGLLEQTPNKEEVINNYFSDTNKDYVYKAKIKVYKNNLSGLLIIKKINQNHHRIVFTTEFGNKIFDFEYVENSFKLNFLVEELNKKYIINTLSKDLYLLVNQNNIITKQFYSEDQLVYQTKSNDQDNYYFISKTKNNLNKIVMASKEKEKMTIFYNGVDNEIAKDIVMIHQNIKMSINLTYLSN
ncbi:MAG: hypothetical protein KAH67_05065 [Flavobacteriaceae bacterium]|nr:hypothetical protein [Flavobacteriaceae bacterium]